MLQGSPLRLLCRIKTHEDLAFVLVVRMRLTLLSEEIIKVVVLLGIDGMVIAKHS
jgi:hypothetical protein